MKKVIVPHPKFLEPNNPKLIGFAMAIIFILILMFAMQSCSHVKKSTTEKETETKQGNTTTVEYRNNTIYTDTGSITTYYRDSVYHVKDTILQPIDRVVFRWYKQDIKHDTLKLYNHDTLTVKALQFVTVKEKTSLPLWFWILVAALIILFGFNLFKRGFKI